MELELYRGNAVARGRASPLSLYNEGLVSMDEAGDYDPTLATGFIQVQALRLKANTARLATQGKRPIPGKQ